MNLTYTQNVNLPFTIYGIWIQYIGAGRFINMTISFSSAEAPASVFGKPVYLSGYNESQGINAIYPLTINNSGASNYTFQFTSDSLSNNIYWGELIINMYGKYHTYGQFTVTSKYPLNTIWFNFNAIPDGIYCGLHADSSFDENNATIYQGDTIHVNFNNTGITWSLNPDVQPPSSSNIDPQTPTGQTAMIVTSKNTPVGGYVVGYNGTCAQVEGQISLIQPRLYFVVVAPPPTNPVKLITN